MRTAPRVLPLVIPHDGHLLVVHIHCITIFCWSRSSSGSWLIRPVCCLHKRPLLSVHISLHAQQSPQ